MVAFETRPVSEIPITGGGKAGKHRALYAAFDELPQSRAILTLAGESSLLTTRRTKIATLLKVHFPTRRIHTSLDHDKDGVWVWWEPKT